MRLMQVTVKLLLRTIMICFEHVTLVASITVWRDCCHCRCYAMRHVTVEQYA